MSVHKKIDLKRSVRINEISAHYDIEREYFYLEIDKNVLPRDAEHNEIAVFNPINNQIYFICQSPGMTIEQVKTTIEICEKIKMCKIGF